MNRTTRRPPLLWSTLLQPAWRGDRRVWTAIRLALLCVVLVLASLLVATVLQPQRALIETQRVTITRQDSAFQEAMETITLLRAIMEAQRHRIHLVETMCLETPLERRQEP
jgi:uncharacterized metal-binding protein